MPEPREEIIYNCHVHTFTIDHVPRNFIPRPFSWLMRRKVALKWVLPAIRIWSLIWDCPSLLRYARFAKLSLRKDQFQVFEELESRYPPATRFVVLPMDLGFIRKGDPFESIDKQHETLCMMCGRYPSIIPFFAADPRRAGVLDKLKRAIEDWGFGGIKIYPNLGYRPGDQEMKPLWKYANEMRLPVMTHCSRGGMHGYDRCGTRVTVDNAGDYSAPKLYKPILDEYPDMRLCLAHIGGQDEWEKYLKDPWYVTDPRRNPVADDRKSWLSDILDMLPHHPNLYTDISYTVFQKTDFVPALKVFLQGGFARERILFGSDYYMADIEDGNERTLSIHLRAALGEELFWQIANVNPKRYLN